VSILALTISGGVKTIGAYAGLAAIVVLALLSLLYFAQARELKRLSEWADREIARRNMPPPPQAQTGLPVRPAAPVAPPVIPPVGTGAPVVTTVEGTRRVAIPAAAAGAPSIAPPAGPPAAPDAVTASGEPASADETAAPGAGESGPVAGEQTQPPPPAGETPVPGPADQTGVQAQPAEPPSAMLPPAPEPAPATLPRLIAEAVPGQARGTAHEIGTGLLIGRGKVATLQLSDPLASARHARVSKHGDAFLLEDLGSTNGTFVNGVQLSTPAQLAEGDRIRLGESEFTFRLASGAPEPNVIANPPQPAAVPLLATPAPERAVELPPDEGLPPLPPRVHRTLRHPFAHEEEAEQDGPRLPPAPEPERPPGRARWLAVAAIVVALAAVAIAIVELAPGSSPKKPGQHTSPPAAASGPSAATTTAPPQKRHGPSGPAPSSVTVAVFNGTTRAGLAGGVSAKLAGDGYSKGAIANAAGQSTTTVGYGTGERAAALEVARSLGLPASDVAPMTSTAAGAAAGAQVAVTLGADYAG
jgi:predicted component of type VI protein secretion system